MERFCSEQVDLRVNLDIFQCSMKGKCALAEIGDVLSIMDRLQHWYEKSVGQYRKVRLQGQQIHQLMDDGFCTGSDRKCGGAENPAGMDRGDCFSACWICAYV